MSKLIEPQLSEAQLKNNPYWVEQKPAVLDFGFGAGRLVRVTFLVLLDAASLLFGLVVAISIHNILSPLLSTAFTPLSLSGSLLIHYWLPLLSLFCLTYEGLSRGQRPFWIETQLVEKVLTLSFIIALFFKFFANSANTSLSIIILYWLLTLFTVPCLRWQGKKVVNNLNLGKIPVLIVGAGQTSGLFLEAIEQDRALDYKVIGLIDDDPKKQRFFINQKSGNKIRVLGRFDDIKEIIAASGAKHVVMATPGLPGENMVNLVKRLQHCCRSILVVPDLIGLPCPETHLEYLFNQKMIVLKVKNNLSEPINVLLKRLIDIVGGMVCLIIGMPLLVTLALIIRIESPGPIIFSHRRIGQNGREFNCYKFRTMVDNAQKILDQILKSDPAIRQEWENNYKLKKDPRITRIGSWLRKTSLDELPQIINVLKGEMSLVGPRPIVQNEVPKFGENIEYFYQVKPGITGLWQVSGRNDINYETRVGLEAWYVQNWSLWLDLTILVRTCGVVFNGNGAY